MQGAFDPTNKRKSSVQQLSCDKAYPRPRTFLFLFVLRFESMCSSLTKTRSSHVLRMQLCGAGLAAAALAPAHTPQMQLNPPPAQEQLQERGGRTAAGSCSSQQPAVGSCSLLHSWRRGEGGYSLARPAAPPLVGNLRNPPSQSLPNVSRFEGLGKFFSLVLNEVRVAAARSNLQAES